ncbi:hypothetical protein PMAYCL1PPCAC_10322, partial [Pristionchus mayeri]
SVDILEVVVAIALIRYNRIKIRELSNASLVDKFRNRQTLRSIEQTLPVAVIHLVSFSIQYGNFVACVQNNDTTPYYCAICAAVFLVIMIREEREKRRELEGISSSSSEAIGEEYFQSLQQQWSTPSLANVNQERNKSQGRRISPV